MARLVIPLRNHHFWFRKTVRPGVKGWLIDDIAWVLTWIVNNYDAEKIGPKPEFARAEVSCLLQWLLFKKFPVSEIPKGEAPQPQSNRMLRAQLFARHYLKNACNGARAAREMGYSPRRARQTAWEIMSERPRRRY